MNDRPRHPMMPPSRNSRDTLREKAGEFGLGSPRFRVELERCRGGRTGAWLMEAAGAYSWEKTDVAHPLRLVAELGDRQLAPAPPLSQVA